MSDTTPTRAGMLERLAREAYQVPPGQRLGVRRMTPEDALGVARLFFAVYGASYPFETYYVPERLVEANLRGDVLSAVAFTRSGDVVAHAALYRSSAPFRGLFEAGQATVLPAYRSTFAMPAIGELLFEKVAPSEEGIEAVFGEAVTLHVATQRFGAMAGLVETGIEVGLMPAATYAGEGAGSDRISTVLAFRVLRDAPRPLFLPAEYASELRGLLPALGLPRELSPAAAAAPPGSTTRLSPLFYDEAGVARLNVEATGEDFDAVLREAEGEARRRGCEVVQAFVNLGEAACGAAVAALRARGFFFGGVLPRWFDTDGLLLQRLPALPRLDALLLDAERSREILALVRADLERNPSCRDLLAAAAR